MTRLGLVVSVTYFEQREREGEPREHDCRRFGLSLHLLSHMVYIIYTVVLFNFKKPNTKNKNKKQKKIRSNKSRVSGIVLFIYLFVCFICSFSFLYLFFFRVFSLFMFCFFFFREHQPVNLHAFLQLSDRVHSRPEKEHTEKYLSVYRSGPNPNVVTHSIFLIFICYFSLFFFFFLFWFLVVFNGWYPLRIYGNIGMSMVNNQLAWIITGGNKNTQPTRSSKTNTLHRNDLKRS